MDYFEEAVRWLICHPEFSPIFQEGRAARGMISLVGFAHDHVTLWEVDFPRIFASKPKVD